MSLKIRRSRGGWQVWRHGSVQAIPPNGGKLPKPRKLKPEKICKGLTRGEAKYVVYIVPVIESEIREAAFGWMSNPKPFRISLADNLGGVADTVSDVLSRCTGVSKIQSEDI